MRYLLLLSGVLFFSSACGPKPHDKKKAFTRIQLAKNHLKRGEWENARQEAKRATQFSPDNAEAYYITGLSYLFQSRAVVKLLQIDNCLTGLDADAHEQEKQEYLDLAEQSFRQSLQRNKADPEVWHALGVAYLHQEKNKDSRLAFEESLAVPGLKMPFLANANLGWVYFREGQHVQAAKHLRKALQVKPTHCVSSYRMARVYFERKEWDKARELFRQVVNTKDCALQEANLFAQHLALRSGETDEAGKARARCVQLAPQSCIAARCLAGGEVKGVQ